MWSGVETAVTSLANNYSTSLSNFNFDNLQDVIIIDPDNATRIWTPTADAKIETILVQSADSAGSTFTITIKGNMNSDLELTVTGGTTSRDLFTIPPGRFGVLAGDAIEVRVSTGGMVSSIPFLRVSVMATSGWARI